MTLPHIISTKDINHKDSIIILTSDLKSLGDYQLNTEEQEYIQNKISNKQTLVSINKLSKQLFIRYTEKEGDGENEKIRTDAKLIYDILKTEEISSVSVLDLKQNKENISALLEGLALSAYSFTKFQTKKEKPTFSLKEIKVSSPVFSDQEVKELNTIVDAVYQTRTLVNLPVDKLNATELGEFIMHNASSYGYKAEVFNKNKIESLKFGGLLAVNKGSIDPPTFSIMEWKPEHPINTKPYILVGKGVVFDTGGINLKTPPGSLDTMKCDMGGAAAVIGTMMAISKNKLPVHIIGLIPSTDNRPGQKAYVPGDILTMHNGMTVEVLNTDAEGRLILADALSYANKYEPELVIDLATLTGAAAVAIGEYGTVCMGTADEITFDQLERAGFATHERVVKFPFWSDYDELIKSDIADIKNIGGREGGAITAGKFLSNFVQFPWIHMDIAGPAFLLKESSYRGKGGTGVGVRILYQFFKSLSTH